MDVSEILSRVRDVAGVGQVFGERYARDGMLVVPVARVQGGAGGGNGTSNEPQKGGSGWGGGFGLETRPLGVYVIRGTQVAWQPALDVSQIILRSEAVAIVALLVLRRILRGPRRVRVVEILRNLWRRKLRTTLTVTGIVMGIFALTPMGPLAEHFNVLLGGGITYSRRSVQVAEPARVPR